MSQCQAPGGCSFFAPVGGRYCSSHFRQFATETEKAELQASEDRRKQEIENAERAWNAALDGPIEAAKDALVAVKNMPGFYESWIGTEIRKPITTNFHRILNLAESDAFHYQDRLIIPAVILSLIMKHIDPHDPLFQQLLQHRTITAETIDFEMMEEAIYRHGNIEMVEKLIDIGKVTKRLVDTARYSCKRPANVPTPKKLAVVKLIEERYKAQQQQAKQTAASGPEVSSSNRSSVRGRRKRGDGEEEIEAATTTTTTGDEHDNKRARLEEPEADAE
jgi:hypothetical protein